MAHQLVFNHEGDDSSAVFKRRRQASFDESDAGIGITSTVLSPAIHIVPPRHDNSRDRVNPEILHRKRRMDEDDRATTCDSSDTLLDEDEEMPDDATYVDCDDLDDDENVVESMVEVCKTGELIGAHVPEYWKRKNHFVRLWQSLAGRIEHGEGPTSPLRYLAGWTNENRKRDRMAQKRRSSHTSSGSSIGEDRFWTGNGKRRRSSTADSTLDMATSNDDYISSKKSHRPISMSFSDIGDIRQSPRHNTESGLPRYYPGGWPTPPGENDETDDNDDDDDDDSAMNTEKDDCDLLISSELALDAQVMGPSVSEYFILDRDRGPEVCGALAVTPESDDEYDDEEDAEYFHDFGSLLQSLRDVAKSCTSSVCSPSSSAGFISPTRPPIVVIDHHNNKRDNNDNKNKNKNKKDKDKDRDDGDGIMHGAGVDYDDCNLVHEFDDTSMTVENDGFEIVVRDGTSLSSSPIEGCGIMARMPSSFPT
ncbi:uncharacterized protein V1513DRAFT_444574 [Lipomyces chichibuensis]|uniref:uncharacterized protein n=1 Tax=Lipomyces chichibuensis TaxID=1546026 RepID=UPI0033432D2D